MQSILKPQSICLGLVGLMMGCTTPSPSQEATSQPTSFTCADGQVVQVLFSENNAETVTINLPGQDALVLPQVVAASGAKYSDGTTTFWEKGGEAFVEISGDIILEGCRPE